MGYFLCFLCSLLSVINAHLQNDGTMTGNFFGSMKIVVFACLTVGYGWFAFAQPVKVFELPRSN